MQNQSEILAKRLLGFTANSVTLSVKLTKTPAGRYIANQLMRSCASSGANYEEACGAESKADFIHKMQLVFKELRESLYWLRLVERSELIPTKDLQILQNEADQLVKIIAKSVITAKAKPR
jgi:four helix bundle protein